MIYKNKFVAFYDQEDNCVFIGETWQEIARYLEKKVSNVQSSLSHVFKHNDTTERKHVICRGKKITPYLIELEEGEF